MGLMLCKEMNMLKFKIKQNKKGDFYLETNLTGKALLDTSKLNKGCAFTVKEREEFNLLGKLPHRVELLEQQSARHYKQFKMFTTAQEKNTYLNALHNDNETVFYKLISGHLEEMLPIIYTPTVSAAVEKFSIQFRRQRGIYLPYPERDRIETMLNNRLNPDVDLIVVSDGSAVLGIGDQGVGGMAICIGKLMVYTLCGGLNPHRFLPIQLDVGTNNKELLNDPMYLGWRHERISETAYDDFIEQFVSCVKRKFPKVFLHWEDVERNNAMKILNRYRNSLCTFNDDVQGTGAVTLGCILSALNRLKLNLKDQRIVIYGAGAAAMGIADHLVKALVREGLSENEAYAKFWMINRGGLLTDNRSDLNQWQRPYAKSPAHVSQWQLLSQDKIGLLDAVKNVKPTLLIGCSTAKDAFTKDIVQTMAKFVEHPIILPLSNPSSKSEATPKDLLQWTNGKALVATGSPFEPVTVDGQKIRIAQCNNAFIFPGIGLGVIASQANRLTDNMLIAASHVLANASHNAGIHTPLLPELTEFPEFSKKIALAVAEQAQKDGVANVTGKNNLKDNIETLFWLPQYYPYKKV